MSIEFNLYREVERLRTSSMNTGVTTRGKDALEDGSNCEFYDVVVNNIVPPLKDDMLILIHFHVTNTISAKLKVNGDEYRPITWRGANISDGILTPNSSVILRYLSGNWEIVDTGKTTKEELGLNNVSNESKLDMFNNPKFTGVPTSTYPDPNGLWRVSDQIVTCRFLNDYIPPLIMCSVITAEIEPSAWVDIATTLPPAIYSRYTSGYYYRYDIPIPSYINTLDVNAFILIEDSAKQVSVTKYGIAADPLIYRYVQSIYIFAKRLPEISVTCTINLQVLYQPDIDTGGSGGDE